MQKLIKISFLIILLMTPLSAMSGKFDYVISDIPELYDYLNDKKIPGSWGAFAPNEMPNGYQFPINIQFSVENGVVGLDWPLSSPANIKDREALEGFAEKKNIKFTLVRAPNGFEYLRCEDQAVRNFSIEFLKEFYGFKESASVSYFSGGF